MICLLHETEECNEKFGNKLIIQSYLSRKVVQGNGYRYNIWLSFFQRETASFPFQIGTTFCKKELAWSRSKFLTVIDHFDCKVGSVHVTLGSVLESDIPKSFNSSLGAHWSSLYWVGMAGSGYQEHNTSVSQLYTCKNYASCYKHAYVTLNIICWRWLKPEIYIFPVNWKANM